MFLMDKVFYMKKRKKGAISIFLILIFLATFMLSAVLVDGGRYRMAQVMAESALDSAGQSVLSYYNQMLYDLYGLMAVDPQGGMHHGANPDRRGRRCDRPGAGGLRQ